MATDRPSSLSGPYCCHPVDVCSTMEEFIRLCILMPHRPNEYRYSFVLDTVLGGIITVCGLTGNFISLAVLNLRSGNRGPLTRGNRTSNFLLRCLCLTDTCFLIIYPFFAGLRSLFPITGLLPNYFFLYYSQLIVFIWPLALTLQTVINWLLVLITLERYLTVQPPFFAKCFNHLNGIRCAVWVIIICSALYTLPRLFEHRAIPSFLPGINFTVYHTVDTPLRSNLPYLIVYRTLLYCLLVSLGPVLLLICLNIFLLLAIRRAYRQPSCLMDLATLGTSSLPTSANTYSTRRSISGSCYQYIDRARGITPLILVTVIVFIVCESPALGYQVYAAIQTLLAAYPSESEIVSQQLITPSLTLDVNSTTGQQWSQTQQPSQQPQQQQHRDELGNVYMVSTGNFLIAIKSSANFLIYCFCDRRFRFLLKRMLARWCSQARVRLSKRMCFRRQKATSGQCCNRADIHYHNPDHVPNCNEIL